MTWKRKAGFKPIRILSVKKLNVLYNNRNLDKRGGVISVARNSSNPLLSAPMLSNLRVFYPDVISNVSV
jgi:hypothetical protein